MRIANLEIPVPGDWEDHSLYTFVSPVEDVSPAMRVGRSLFRSNVVIQQNPLGDDSLADRVQRALDNTTETFGEVEVQVEDGPSNPDFVCKRLRYTVVDGVTNQPVGQLIYVCAVDDMEWQVAFSVAAINMERRLSEFDGIVASMRKVPK